MKTLMRFTGSTMVFLSMPFGLLLWLFCAWHTYIFYGWIGLILSALTFIGVVPVALFGFYRNGFNANVELIIAAVVLVAVLKYGGAFLIAIGDRRDS